MDTKKSGGRSPWSRFDLNPLVLDVLGTPGGGALPTASVRVRRVEVMVLLVIVGAVVTWAIYTQGQLLFFFVMIKLDHNRSCPWV